MKPVIRASEMSRVLGCPGSMQLVPRVNAREGDESHEGIALHWMIAASAVYEFGAAEPAGGLAAADIPKNYNIPKGSQWIIEWAKRQIRHHIPGNWGMEVEGAFAYEFEQFTLSGHIDVFGISPDYTEAIGLDWKTGYTPADPAELNEQVLSYIVLLKRAYPQLTKITFGIAQPRNDEDEGHERLSTVTVEGEDLEAVVYGLEERVNAALARPNEIETGKTQCTWCPVGIQCPAIQAEIEKMKLTLTPDMIAAIKAQPDDALLGDIFIAGKTFEKALEDAKELLGERIDKTKSITAGCGAQITTKIEGGKYKALDPYAVLTGLRAVLPERAIAEVSSYSVTRIKDELSAALNVPKTGKAAMTAETVFGAKFAHLFEQGKRRKFIIS